MLYTETNRTDEAISIMYEKGIDYLSNTDLLYIVTGCNNPAKIMVSYIESLESLAFATLDDFTKCNFTDKEYAAFKAGIELGRRLDAQRNKPMTITSPDDVANWLIPKYSYRYQEYFGIVLLDTKNNVIGEEIIFIGSLNRSIVHPREVFCSATQHHAASIILFHNHPSGSCTASREDINITNRLKKAGELMEIPVLDHIIMGRGEYNSMKEEGLF